MSPHRLFELVRTATADGLVLDGAFAAPLKTASQSLDACLFLHGTGSNFYAGGVLEVMADSASAAGLAVLRVNTRGHDGISSLAGRSGSQRGGATYERISDCLCDVSAWLDWLRARGFGRIALIGHSMGGVKAVYSQAREPCPAVGAIVGVSPPRFHHSSWMLHPRADRFRADFARAQELVAAGAQDALLAVTQPVPYVATAAGFIEKYGPEDKYDFVPLLERLQRPTLILIGSKSEAASPAFERTLEVIHENSADWPHVTAERVEGADINYRGQLDEPYARFSAWWSRVG